MVYILNKNTHKKRPSGIVSLRENHWSNQNLVHYSHMSMEQTYDLVTGTSVSAQGSSNKWLPIGLNCDSTASYIAYPYSILSSVFSEITIFVTLRHNFAYTYSPANYPVISEWCNGTYLVNNTQTAGYRLIATTGTARPRFRSYHPAGANLDCSSSPTWEINERFCYAFVFDGSQKRIYRKSTLIGSISQTGNIAATTTGQLIVGGGLQTGYADSIIEQFAIYDRALSLSEIVELNNNPYQILKPYSTIYSIASAGAGGIALTGNSISLQTQAIANSSDLDITGNTFVLNDGSISNSFSKELASEILTIASDSISIDISNNLTGNLLQNAIGNLLPSTVKTVIGELISLSTGILSASLAGSVQLSGQEITLSVGNIQNSFNKAITGNSLIINLENITPSNGKDITSNLLSLLHENITISTNSSLLGEILSLIAGNVSAQIGNDVSVALSGLDLINILGNLLNNTDVNINGIALNLYQESLLNSLSILPIGQELLLNTGNTKFSFTKTLEGNILAAGTGTLIFQASNITVPLTGQEIVTTQGTIIILGDTPIHVSKIYIGNTSYFIYII